MRISKKKTERKTTGKQGSNEPGIQTNCQQKRQQFVETEHA